MNPEDGDVSRSETTFPSGPGPEGDEYAIAAAGRPIDVLVVEDDGDTREALTELLRREGYSVLSAANGVEALHQLHRGRTPLIMLLDLRMPLMDGWELCRILYASRDPRFAEIPIAIVTGQNEPRRLPDRRRDAGLFRKPIDFDVLLEAIQSYCR